MDGSGRCSSRRGLAAASGAVALALVAGCVERLPPLEGTTSLRVELHEPSETGAVGDRLDDDALRLVISITALDADGEVDTSLSDRVDLHSHFLGSLTPPIGAGALATATLEAGIIEGVELELPRAFGPTFLWVEHSAGDAPTWATGTSPILWYRDPYLADIQRPEDESALDALERSPLEQKQVVVTRSRYGAAGRLVVTGTYAQGYTVSDVQCQDDAGTPPCVPGDYDHMFVFTFNRPRADDGRNVRPGHTLSRLTGGVIEFNGLTEIGFPQTFLADTTPRAELIPAPVVIEPAWLGNPIERERVESGLVAVDGATLCPLDDDFARYSQWKLDIGLGCARNSINVITQGQVQEFEPAPYVGAEIPRVVGTLRPVNIGSFHVWIIYPRSIDDLELPPL
jgi:hypothetical protein